MHVHCLSAVAGNETFEVYFAIIWKISSSIVNGMDLKKKIVLNPTVALFNSIVGKNEWTNIEKLVLN